MSLKSGILALVALVCLGLAACDDAGAPAGGGNAAKQIDSSATPKNAAPAGNAPKAQAD